MQAPFQEFAAVARAVGARIGAAPGELARLEVALVDLAAGRLEPAAAVELAACKVAGVATALGALQGAAAVEDALVERALVDRAVVPLEPAMALEAALAQLAVVAAAVGSDRVGRAVGGMGRYG